MLIFSYCTLFEPSREILVHIGLCHKYLVRLEVSKLWSEPSTTAILCMHGSRGGTGGPNPPLKNVKNIGFLSNTGPEPLKIHKATESAFNVGPSSARQRNA